MKFLKSIFLVLVFFPSICNSAVVNTAGKITQIKMFPLAGGVSGVVLYMDELAPACSASNPGRVLIKTDNPLFEAALSVALTAKTTGSKVEIGYIDQCSSITNAWDFQHMLLK